MHRSFKVTLPADTTARSLYDAMTGANGATAITGAKPTDGILPDRCCFLKITSDTANAANTLTVADLNVANTSGRPLTGGDTYEVGPSMRNSICLRDYKLVPQVNSMVYELDLEYV